MFELHRPELTLNAARKLGKIKPLHGGNMAPPLDATTLMDISEPFRELELPYTRLHDCPCGGWNIVDIELIFPLWHLDAADPRNYFFAQTDEYIGHCLELGTQVIYRLGPTIEHHLPKYHAKPVPRERWPQWAEVAANIIRHYNEGWGNGFHFGIRYWEIWNEPEGLWAWTEADESHKLEKLDEFNEFYCFVAKYLKQRFPDIMIGGPAHVRITDGFTQPFLKKVAEEKAPLDFYSWHCYADNVEYMRDQVFLAREIVDSYGFTQTELHLNEWHYVPGSWSKIAPEKKPFHYEYKMKTMDAGAFLAATLIAWQDTPLDMACYYTVTTTAFGLFSPFGVPSPSYYCMKAFGQFMHYPERLEVLSNDRDLYALAGTNGEGEFAILLSAFHVRGNFVYLTCDRDIDSMEVLVVNDPLKLEPLKPVIDGPRAELPLGCKPAVLLVRMKLKDTGPVAMPN